MLILTRRRGQVIRIADNIIVTVVAVNGGSVRLGFDTDPQTIPILRGEIYDAEQRDNRPESVDYRSELKELCETLADDVNGHDEAMALGSILLARLRTEENANGSAS